jgi:hypothetical protein
MMTVEAVKRAQSKFGAKPLTGTEVRWGLEHLALDEQATTSWASPVSCCRSRRLAPTIPGAPEAKSRAGMASAGVVEPTMYQPT